MKKLVLTVIILLSSGISYALPIGNPAEASLFTQGVFFGSSYCNSYDPCFRWFDAWSLRVGYYGDFVYNRNLQIDGTGFDDNGNTIQQTQIFTNAGYIALNICDKLDIFGTLGASKISILTSDASWIPVGGTQNTLDWETYFSWSAGARATLIQWRCFSIGVEGQYFQTTPKLTTFVSYVGGLYNYFNEENKMKYSDWQAGAGLSYTLKTCSSQLTLVPYAGIKCGWARFKTDNFQFVRSDIGDVFTIFNMRAKKLWGYAVGVTATLCSCAGISVEGRWADEKAVYVNGQFRF